MKLLTFFLILGTLVSSASSYSQATKLDLRIKNATVEEILQIIENSSEFIFIYDADLIKSLEKKSISVRAGSIEEILEKLLQGAEVEYMIDDRQVFLYEKDKLPAFMPSKVEDVSLEIQQPRTKEISGTVTDISGQPLIGVSIVLKGTATGTITDIKGNFRLEVPLDAQVLVFSYVGMKAQEVDIMERTSVNIVLEEELVGMEEVVVVGYGIQRKESIVGAISQATGDQIRQAIQGSDLGTALRGSLPGLIALQSTGIPGGTDYFNPIGNAQSAEQTTMFIRGQSTWNASSPLILVDGVERNLININPYEIERISLLKDASATAVFGVRGANGVILITTLRGREGRAKLSFDASTTAKGISRIAELEDSYTGLLNKNYAILNEVPITESAWASITPWERLVMYRDQTYPYYLPDVNWADEFTKDFQLDQNVNMSVSGGTKFVRYYGSIAYIHEGDILNIKEVGQGYNPENSFDRLNWRSNLDFNITRTTKFSANLAGQFYKQKRAGGSMYGGWYNIYRQPPDVWPIKYSDGTWAERVALENLQNGFLEKQYNGYSLARGTDVTTDFVLEQQLDFITKGLSTSLKASFDNNMKTYGSNISDVRPLSKYIYPDIVDEIVPGMSETEIRALEEKYTVWNVPGSTSAGYDWTETPHSYGSESAQTESVYRNLYYQYAINYTRDFNKHEVTGLALVSRQLRANGSEFMNYREDWVGRVTYSYDRKYLAEFNAAYNGSEKFSNEYRFGFFPSMAFGWVISNETFFKPVKPVMNTFKLRYSDGKVGSDEGIDRWQYVGSWRAHAYTSSTTNQRIYRFGTPYLVNAYPLRYEGVIPNKDIHWETARKRDFGIEAGFFDNLIQLNFDYFIENRRDIFLSGAERPIASYYGAVPVSANEGAVDVKGWEFEGQIGKTFMNGLYLWATHAWAYAKDKVIERGDPELKKDYQKLAGYQIGQPRVTLQQSETSVMSSWNEIYTTVGALNNANLLPGDFRRVDFNSDGYIDNFDSAPFGYPERPQFTYAPSAGFSYKNWSANVRFYGVYNIEGKGPSYTSTFNYTLTTLYPWDMERRWSPENDHTTNAVWPHLRLITTDAGGYVPYRRDYIRLQSAEVTYTLDGEWIKRLGLTNFRLKLSGNNLFLWSKMYEDFDYAGSSNVDRRFSYPLMKRYTVGISMNFR